MSALFELTNLVVVLVRPRNPLNIGAVARAMSNFGVTRLRLVNPYSEGFREARSAVGASQLLKDAEEFKILAEAVADCTLVVGTTGARNRALQHPAHQLDRHTAGLIRKKLRRGRVALLFGSEKFGLSNDDFSHCHWLTTIPTMEDHVSMNLGQAVAVCLYALSLAPALKAAAQKKDPATAGENTQIIDALLEALHRSGYVKPGTDLVMEKKVRRLIIRLKLDKMDVRVLLGMVRQMLWKLRQSPNDSSF